MSDSASPVTGGAGRPTVTVVIPTHNRAELVLRALRSVQRQTVPPLEIVVVDDGSSDDTAARLAAVGDSRLRYLRNDAPRGAAAARNRGIEAARGDVVAFLDSDDEWLPNTLELQLAALTPEHGAVYGRHIAVHPDGREQVNPEPLPSGDIRAALLGGWCPTTTSLFVVRTDALRRVNGFDESLPSFHDYDLWLRLSEHIRFAVVEAPVIRFHVHEGPRISAQIEARRAAFDRFMAKWEAAFRAHLGVRGFEGFLRRRRATDYRTAAFGALKRGERWQAVRLLTRALVARPAQPRSWLHLAVALAGPGIYRALSRIRHRRPIDSGVPEDGARRE